MTKTTYKQETVEVQLTGSEAYILKENLEQHVRVCQNKEGGKKFKAVLNKLEDAAESDGDE